MEKKQSENKQINLERRKNGRKEKERAKRKERNNKDKKGKRKWKERKKSEEGIETFFKRNRSRQKWEVDGKRKNQMEGKTN